MPAGKVEEPKPSLLKATGDFLGGCLPEAG